MIFTEDGRHIGYWYSGLRGQKIIQGLFKALFIECGRVCFVISISQKINTPFFFLNTFFFGADKTFIIFPDELPWNWRCHTIGFGHLLLKAPLKGKVLLHDKMLLQTEHTGWIIYKNQNRFKPALKWTKYSQLHMMELNHDHTWDIFYNCTVNVYARYLKCINYTFRFFFTFIYCFDEISAIGKPQILTIFKENEFLTSYIYSLWFLLLYLLQ